VSGLANILVSLASACYVSGGIRPVPSSQLLWHDKKADKQMLSCKGIVDSVTIYATDSCQDCCCMFECTIQVHDHRLQWLGYGYTFGRLGKCLCQRYNDSVAYNVSHQTILPSVNVTIATPRITTTNAQNHIR